MIGVSNIVQLIITAKKHIHGNRYKGLEMSLLIDSADL